MNKIIFCDKNKKLKDKVKKLFEATVNNTHCELIVSKFNDVFKTKENYKNTLICTASNPYFNMAGGLDLAIKNKYPEQCENAREFKFTKDLFFLISCDTNIKTKKEIIKRALLGVYFASRKQDVIITGLGTAIAGLDEDSFIEELKLFLNANFYKADFNKADFNNANFNNADFNNADFYKADFSNAYFYKADFNNADFSNADFSNADFSNADFSNAYFSNANFSNAYFRDANFNNADFSNADFSNANFNNAYFNNANFNNANFINAKFNYRILPKKGNIIGWKKCGEDKIVELKINVKTAVGGMISRKCRCKSAKVISIKSVDGKTKYITAVSTHDSKFKYKIGETVIVEDWNDKSYLECEKGIHFFITRDEAVNY